jgi:hypothetical protein
MVLTLLRGSEIVLVFLKGNGKESLGVPLWLAAKYEETGMVFALCVELRAL